MTAENVKPNGQLFVGTCVITGKKIHLPYDQLTQHISACGATGSGKSFFSKLLMKQQVINGGGLLIINGGLSSNESDELYKIAGLAGRESEFVAISPVYTENSNSYSPKVNFEDYILQNKILYINIPTGMANEKSIALTKLIFSDFREAISRLQRTPANELPNPPFLFLPNDCAPYIDKSWSRVFEQARTSRISITTMFQSLVDLQPAGDETNSDIVMGNSKFKFFFKQSSLESAEKCADEIGTRTKVQIKNGETNPSSDETYIISPEQLQSIPVGDCLLLIGGEELYRLRLPSPNN